MTHKYFINPHELNDELRESYFYRALENTGLDREQIGKVRSMLKIGISIDKLKDYFCTCQSRL